MNPSEVAAAIGKAQVLAVVRTGSEDGAVLSSQEIIRGGFVVVEISLTTPGAIPAIARLSDLSGVVIGAGTLRTRLQVDQVVDAGAQFVVTPHTDPELISHAVRRGLVVGPGVFTPTDCARALDAGAHFLKLFPAHLAGIEAMAALAGPFPEARWIPTGKIGPHNMLEWLDAGATAVGIGSELTSGGVSDCAPRAAAIVELLRTRAT